MKRIFIVRHCKALGQEQDADLTVEGYSQAIELAGFLSEEGIDYVISSPYLRARHSIEPLCRELHLHCHIDDRLKERVLSTEQYNDWMERLKDTYVDFDLKYEGGESSKEATARGVEVIQETFERKERSIVLVTHGVLMSLMINNFNQDFGFEQWRKLSNPDVYCIKLIKEHIEITRTWNR